MIRNTKEYGGYLPLELSRGQEYYQMEHVIALNKARSAILLAIQDGSFEKVYLPIFMCPSVAEFIQRESDIQIEYYSIDEKFLPPDIILKEKECMFWANYFGIAKKSDIEMLSGRYGSQLIIDNTQAFFHEPFGDSYFVYSCRKFFGVSDGAYLYQKNLRKRELEKSSSSKIDYLLQVYELGTNELYHESLLNEEKIEDETILEMSLLTHRILESVDYASVQKKRTDNFKALHHTLSDYNELEIPLEGINAPMVYPFLASNDLLRGKLIENHVYVPQWWKAVLESNEANLFEKKLSKYLIPLPMDQRYSEQDMEAIAQIVISCLEK